MTQEERYALKPGEKHKEWTIIKRVGSDKKRNILYLVQCKCGFLKVDRGSDIKRLDQRHMCHICAATELYLNRNKNVSIDV